MTQIFRFIPQALASILALAALAGCDKAGEAVNAAKTALVGGPTAKSLAEVRSVYLKAETCPDGIRRGLAERGFTVVDKEGKHDAVLNVNVSLQGRNLDKIPSFGGVGNKASYSAQLLGAGDTVLFTTSGSEGSINMEELCQDIGDNIGQRLRGG